VLNQKDTPPVLHKKYTPLASARTRMMQIEPQANNATAEGPPGQYLGLMGAQPKMMDPTGV